MPVPHTIQGHNDFEDGKALTAAGADWQICAYGNTLHGFTNPAANDKDAGTVYDRNADRRSWSTLQEFLPDLF